MTTKRKSSAKKTLARLLSALMITSLIFSMMPMVAFAASANKDSFTKSTIPATMVAGQTYTVKITVKNTGSTTWTAKAGYQLVPVGGSDPFTKVKAIALDAKDSIKPNSSKTFTITLTAPLKNATLTTDWQMAKGTAKFGAILKKSVKVTIAKLNSVVVSCSLPSKLESGSDIKYSVTFKNTGSTKWTDANKFYLFIARGADAYYEIDYATLSSSDSIALGETKTFSGTIHDYTSDLEGDYTYSFIMVCDKEGFGAIASKTVKIYLTDAQRLENATDAVNEAEFDLSWNSLDDAREKVDALPNSSAKTALEARLDAVEEFLDAIDDYTHQLATAKAKVEKAEKTHLQVDVDVAQKLVTALPDNTYKVELQTRLDAVQAAINLVNATAAVKKAESSKTQADVVAAQALVTALPAGGPKASLQYRLDKVQAIIDLAAAKAAAHADLATALAGYSQADYTAANWTVLTKAKADGDKAIDAAATTAAVTAAKNAAITAMAAVTAKP